MTQRLTITGDGAAKARRLDPDPEIVVCEKSGHTAQPRWTQGVCPNCGFDRAPVDPQGVLWCPACGYSKKGIFT